MTIVILLVSFDTLHFFYNIIQKLVRNGHDVHVIYIQELDQQIPEYEFKVHRADWGLFDFELIHKLSPDRILTWNGRFVQVRAAFDTLRKSYKCMTLENGWLPQQGNVFLDYNSGAESNLAKSNWKEEIVTLDQTKNLKELSPLYPYYRKNKKNDYILAPLQMENDTSIVYDSSSFKKMEQLISYVEKNTDQAVPILIKGHPRDKENYDDLKERYSSKKVTFLLEGNNTDIIDNARMCVGINSTLLIEARLFNTRVIQLGDNVLAKADNFTTSLMDLYETSHLTSNTNMASRLARLYRNQFNLNDVPEWVIKKIETNDLSIHS